VTPAATTAGTKTNKIWFDAPSSFAAETNSTTINAGRIT